MREVEVICSHPITEDQKTRLNEAASELGMILRFSEHYDGLEDGMILDFGVRGVWMDRSGSMPEHMVIKLGDEMSHITRQEIMAIGERMIREDIMAPLGKSPDKIRRRQRDWELSSGKGLRR